MTARALSRQEYLADFAVHVAGLAFGIIGTTVLIVLASLEGKALSIVSASIYSFGLIAMLTCSAVYNIIRPANRRSWLRRLDHAAIFVMIAGSCTPFAMQAIPGWGVPALIILWAVALTAAAVKLLMPGRYERLMIWLYLALGWGGAAILAGQIAALPFYAGIMLGLGGVLYSVGVIFHVWESMRFSTAVWHTFVLAAAICHYGAILGGVVLTPA